MKSAAIVVMSIATMQFKEEMKMKEQYFTVCVIKDGKTIEQCEFYGTKEQCEKALSLIGDGEKYILKDGRMNRN